MDVTPGAFGLGRECPSAPGAASLRFGLCCLPLQRSNPAERGTVRRQDVLCDPRVGAVTGPCSHSGFGLGGSDSPRKIFGKEGSGLELAGEFRSG